MFIEVCARRTKDTADMLYYASPEMPLPDGGGLSADAAEWSITMANPNKVSRGKSIRRTKIMAEVIISAAILCAGGYIVKGAFDRTTDVGQSPEFVEEPLEEPTTEEVDPNKIVYETSNVATKDKFRGDLILVNEDHRYFSGDEDLVSITEMNYETDRTVFSAVDEEVHGQMMILRSVYEPMAHMIDDFYDLTGITNILIYGAYRSTDFQQELYEADLMQTGLEDSTRVAKPGYSEHESGYAFDFTTVPDYDYQGTGEYEWFTNNCARYGLIIRYPEDKEDITKIQYEPWHFRYVGIPHAYYITENRLCMEEYIDLLREKYPYEGEHLEFSDYDGAEYEVYFVASDDANELTTVPVPTGMKYEVSGNNVDGFIVTVYKDEQRTSAPPEPVTEEETENEYENGSMAEVAFGL